MKILYLKAGNTVESSGGGAETAKMIYGIEQWVDNHSKDCLIVVSSDRMDIEGGKTPFKTKWKDVVARMLFHSSYLYIDWQFGGLKNLIKAERPDVIVLGNSRLGFVMKNIRRMLPDCYIIVHYDNVEIDYVDASFAMNRSILGKILKTIEKMAVKRDEMNASHTADVKLFLTERDKNRLEAVYGTSQSKDIVLPICLPNSQKKLSKASNNNPELVFLGSLWYESNVNALVWFLEAIWPSVKTSFPNASLKIGGSQPSKYLTEVVLQKSEIRFFPDFDNIADVVCTNSIFISPIQKGAGMKVKVAEALSLGLPILASEESLVGYSEAILDNMNREVIVKAEKKEDYIAGLNRILTSNFEEISNNAKGLFDKYYSYERAIVVISNMLADIEKTKRNNHE